MPVRWLREVGSGDIDTVGGKGASLGELLAADLPVPGGFVVTAGTYRTFVEDAGIAEELFDAVDVDTDDGDALAAAEERARELILGASLPDNVGDDILAAYDELGEGVQVAVRSSATAEDLPEASFAGQQETFLNVSRDALLDRVKECWASLFTERAIYYRGEQGFAHDEVNIAVVVQEMVDAEKSGVMFTSHPSTGADEFVVEAAWGLGEGVVSGEVSPDNYVVDADSRNVTAATVATKKTAFVRDPDTGETVTREVPDEKRNKRVLSETELDRLCEVGTLVEGHYGEPQDVEWAIADGELYVLQSRPVTTIEDDGDAETAEAAVAGTDGGPDAAATGEDGGGDDGAAGESVESIDARAEPNGGDLAADAESGADADAGSGDDGVLVTGLGASPGTVGGETRVVTKLDHLDKVTEGDVIVAEMTTPDMVPAMQRAVGIVTDEGGMTSHAAIVSRELGVPAITGTGDATAVLSDGQPVTVDGERGIVREGLPASDGADESTAGADADEPAEPAAAPTTETHRPTTATEVKVNVSIPDAAERAAATGTDGVGLFRTEHMVLTLGKTPDRYVADHGAEAYRQELVDGIRTVADAFYPQPVRVRTLDAPTDEFRELEGGEDEPDEPNPMLGYRGVRRSLDHPEAFQAELAAFRRLYEVGYDNVEIMFPLVNDADDVRAARALMKDAGIDPSRIEWGVMVETPASALQIDEIVGTGIDFVSFGTNDLTQYTLAVDRNNEAVADRYDELHPAVISLIVDTIETCREHGVETSICGEAASKPQMVETLVESGITSLSVNIDAVATTKGEVQRVEQRLLLDSVR